MIVEDGNQIFLYTVHCTVKRMHKRNHCILNSSSPNPQTLKILIHKIRLKDLPQKLFISNLRERIRIVTIFKFYNLVS